VVALVGDRTGQAFVERDPETVDVGAVIDGHREQRFRRHVFRGPEHGPLVAMLRVGAGELGDAKVEQLDGSAARDE
jgi:hypothetical protein